MYTDGPKADEKVAATAVSSVAPNSPISCRLRDHCSIYTAELQAILFALKQASVTRKEIHDFLRLALRFASAWKLKN